MRIVDLCHRGFAIDGLDDPSSVPLLGVLVVQPSELVSRSDWERDCRRVRGAVEDFYGCCVDCGRGGK
jgi:hypothetical protein